LETPYGSGSRHAELRRDEVAQEHEINDLVRVRLLPLWSAMTTSHSMESTITRKIVWTGVVLLAATVAACGGSTQGIAGTAPSQVSSIAAASDNGGSFNLLKEGRGKGGHSPAPEIGTTPTTGTTPDPDDPEDASDELGKGHGHGKATIQYEGFTKSITGDCPALTIVFDDKDETTVKTEDLTTEFQRATCEALKASTAPSIHLHIAAKKMEDDSLVAIYVRMQGPKFDDGDDADEEEGTTPTTTN
jgi:hypothetical protein